MIRIISILFFIASFSSNACMFPIQGEEYDSLIKIESLEGNEYKVTVPRVVRERTDPIIVLGFDADDSDGFLFADEFINLQVEHKKNKSIAYFTLEDKFDVVPFINVRWPIECCLCDVSANSLIQENED